MHLYNYLHFPVCPFNVKFMTEILFCFLPYSSMLVVFKLYSRIMYHFNKLIFFLCNYIYCRTIRFILAFLKHCHTVLIEMKY